MTILDNSFEAILRPLADDTFERQIEITHKNRYLVFLCKTLSGHEVNYFGMIDGGLRVYFTHAENHKSRLVIGTMDDNGEREKYERRLAIWEQRIAILEQQLIDIIANNSHVTVNKDEILYHEGFKPSEPVYSNTLTDRPHNRMWSKTLRVSSLMEEHGKDVQVDMGTMMELLFNEYVKDIKVTGGRQ